MDSKHRHELEQNDLVVFLTHFNEWWNKYGQMTLIVVLVAVGAFTAMRFYNYNKMQAHENAWGGLAQSTSPESYRATAAENKGAVKALALLRGADLLLAQATVPQNASEDMTAQAEAVKPAAEGAATDPEATPASPVKVSLEAPKVQDPAAMLEDAGKMYQAVVDDASVHVVLRINAMLGLASVAEAQGKWDAAGQAYDKAYDLAGSEYVVLAKQASGRKARLADISKPVVFAKDAPVVQVPAVDKPAPEIKAPEFKLDLSPSVPAAEATATVNEANKAAENAAPAPAPAVVE